MSPRKILFIHLLIWPIGSLIFFFSSEKLIKLLLPEVHDVLFWLYFVGAGLIAIFVLCLVSVLICLVVQRKKRRLSRG